MNFFIINREVWRAWISIECAFIIKRSTNIRKMKKQIYLCVDLKMQMKEQDLQVMDSRKGTLFRNEEDKFTFTEKGARLHEVHEELHWRVLDKCRYGKVSANANNVKLELYIPHEVYEDGRDLADIMASQVEQMGENLCEMDMAKVVEAIRALRKETSC